MGGKRTHTHTHTMAKNVHQLKEKLNEYRYGDRSIYYN